MVWLESQATMTMRSRNGVPHRASFASRSLFVANVSCLSLAHSHKAASKQQHTLHPHSSLLLFFITSTLHHFHCPIVLILAPRSMQRDVRVKWDNNAKSHLLSLLLYEPHKAHRSKARGNEISFEV